MTAHVRTYVLVCSQGFLNGNIGVAKAYLADVCDEKSMAKGFSALGMAGGMGRLVGPAAGAYMVNPATKYPGMFVGTIFQQRPVVFWIGLLYSKMISPLSIQHLAFHSGTQMVSSLEVATLLPSDIHADVYPDAVPFLLLVSMTHHYDSSINVHPDAVPFLLPLPSFIRPFLLPCVAGAAVQALAWVMTVLYLKEDRSPQAAAAAAAATAATSATPATTPTHKGRDAGVSESCASDGGGGGADDCKMKVVVGETVAAAEATLATANIGGAGDGDDQGWWEILTSKHVTVASALYWMYE